MDKPGPRRNPVGFERDGFYNANMSGTTSHIKPRVLLAMSGGVDSSAAAALLMEQGYDVVGCFMRLGSPDEPEGLTAVDTAADAEAVACATGLELDQPGVASGATTGAGGISLTQVPAKKHKQGCCSVNDAEDARQVAGELGVPFYVLNFRRDFGRIMDYFTAEYHAGRTPNPCVRCNDWLKFGKLHQYAASLGADFVASGHYARIDRTDPDRPRLMRGLDPGKDQSYVLFGSGTTKLKRMLLPLGGMHKSEVRALAESRGLPVFNKPDSQEICFVPDQDYAGFIERREGEPFESGAIVDREGNTLGTHQGHQRFTHGQRRGLGLALGRPVYVVDRDPKTNTVTVGSKDDLQCLGCTADQTTWHIDPPRDWMACEVKVRYNGGLGTGQVRVAEDGTMEVAFDEPIEAVTPGQAVVCFGKPGSPDQDAVLGGGWIKTAQRAE